ncbi:HAD-like domain-containing protein [Melampsora americana]|nr:HAD-like domain-containing protein [Melampsora americana]
MGSNSLYIRFWAGLAISLFFNSISQSTPVPLIPLTDEAKIAKDIKDVNGAKVLPTVKDIDSLDYDKLVKDVQSTKGKVLLMFDVDGTLKSHLDEGRKIIDPWVKKMIGFLSRNEKYEVYLNTGKSETSLLSTYGGDEFNQLGWIAEHGAFIRRPGNPKTQDLRNEFQEGWFRTTMKIMEGMRISGTREEGIWLGKGKMDTSKRATISFTTKEKNEDFNKFFEILKEKLKGTSVVTQHKETQTLIEITPIGMNKGTAVDTLMRERQYDLALAAGDDERDLQMHDRIRQNMIQRGKKAYSIIISRDDEKPTAASHRVEHYRDFVKNLARLSPDYKELYPLTESP